MPCNSIFFKTMLCRFGKDLVVNKHYHYSDIVNRAKNTKSKFKLDSMPELEELKHLVEPIPFSKVKKVKFADNISFSEEVAGSIRTVYSSSDNDERIDDFMSEAAMIEKVSLFLSEASFDISTNRDMLKSSVHDHDLSIVNSYKDSFQSNDTKPDIGISLVGATNRNKKFSAFNHRSMSAQHKFSKSFNYSPRLK